jgi:hypothetical protein
MKADLVRYTVRGGRRTENAALVAGVFKELHDMKPADLGYLVLELEDGTFLHLVCYEAEDTGGLTSLAAFRRFQERAHDRRDGGGERRPARVIGAFNIDRFANLSDAETAHGG